MEHCESAAISTMVAKHLGKNVDVAENILNVFLNKKMLKKGDFLKNWPFVKTVPDWFPCM